MMACFRSINGCLLYSSSHEEMASTIDPIVCSPNEVCMGFSVNRGF